MAAPAHLRALIETFKRNQEEYLSPHYRETRLRVEFLDPCFKLLGWDVDNQAGLGAARREVVHEDELRMGSGLKAPDYSFRIDGARKFFVEAKRPAVNINRDPESAYQLRRYAWSANLPLSILTDFQEWAIYDCRRRPSAQDTATIARHAYIRLDELEERWDELADLISKTAVLNGSLDRFASSTARTRRMAEVDDAFLAEIEAWRSILAQDIARRNSGLSVEALSTAVQQLIDRIVFLRISEARGIEDFGQLRDIAAGRHIYAELLDVFYRADARYNSGLFHFEEEQGRDAPDNLSPRLKVGDDPLKHIVNHLYYPESPYEFAVLPGRILGQVYERFLGSEIVISPTREVAIKLKPEVAKAGGVYYTPGYIADRIVERTVGQLLDATSRTARAAAKELRILDPACGSGSFLLSAYDYLLNWHREYYVSRGPSRFKNEIYKAPSGEWRLTIAERKRILSTNIFGVDLDPQAVETTKLSLLLKVLEGESAETLGQTLALWHDRALPDLDSNIRCGNSLLDKDVLSWITVDMYSTNKLEEELRPFDWPTQFPKVFSRDNPGFDVLLGNPPYISALTMVGSMRPEVKDYWKKRYQSAAGAYDIYVLFVEQGLYLCRQGGLLSYIIPNKFLAAEYAIEFRRMLYEETRFVELVDYSRTHVWKKSVYPVVPVLVQSQPKRTDKLAVSVGDPEVKSTVHPVNSITRSELGALPDRLWSFVTQEGIETLIRVIENSHTLDSCAEVTGSSTVGEGSDFPAVLSSLRPGQRVPEKAVKFVVTGSIGRFVQRWATRPVTYIRKHYIKPILRLEEPVPQRRCDQATKPKLIVAKVAKAPKGFADYEGEFAAAYCTYIFPHEGVSLPALTGVLNSNVVAFSARLMYDALAMSGGYISFQPPQLRRIPICALTDTSKVEELEGIIHDLEELHQGLLEVQAESERARLGAKLAQVESDMEEIVSDLYGLTDGDRQIIADFIARQSDVNEDDEAVEQSI